LPKAGSGSQLGRNARSKMVELGAVALEITTTVTPFEVACATGSS
jgi:hypothetical protein